MRLLITGANGFVGSAVCRAALAGGHQVFAFVRSGSSTALTPSGCKVIRGDFCDRLSARQALEQSRAEAVVHAAAVVPMGRPDLAESWRVNVEGTRTLLAAARRAGVERWLQVSSMSAHPDNKAVYGGTKFAADEVVRRGGVAFTIVRPSLVYGAGTRGIFHKLTNLIRRAPVVPLVGGGEEPMRPVHVDDLAGAMVRALETHVTIGQTYCLGGPEDWRLRDMVEAICVALGRNPRLVAVPLPLCRVIAVLGEIATAHPPLTSDNLEGIARAQPVDTSAAERDLAWRPRSFAEGIRDCEL